MNRKELHDFIEEKQPNICQISCYKDGKEVYSDEWNNYKKIDTCHVMSATKSIVALLVGIALDKGFIKSTDQPVLDFFPEYKIKRGEKTIQKVTIKHLLTMTAPYKYKYEPWTKICSSDDWTVSALDFLGGRKGLTGQFKYSTLGIHAFTILLANAKNPYIILNDGYCGDGGIPGYIFSWLLPNEYTLSHLHVALAHETNHNVRFQFIKWKNDITLGEMIVNEGLAENFATFLYGEDKAGPWVTKTDIETLNEYIKPIIRDGLNVQGLENLNAYLYGDEMAALQNYPQVGLPYCSGYACGYHLIKHYLQKTGKNIVEATLLPAKEILDATEDFWNE